MVVTCCSNESFDASTLFDATLAHSMDPLPDSDGLESTTSKTEVTAATLDLAFMGANWGEMFTQVCTHPSHDCAVAPLKMVVSLCLHDFAHAAWAADAMPSRTRATCAVPA